MSNEIPIAVQQVVIVLGTDSTDPDYKADCNYAVVHLTPELIDRSAAAWNWLGRQVARTTTFTNSTSGAVRRSSTTATCWKPARKAWQPTRRHGTGSPDWRRTGTPWCPPPPTLQPASRSGSSASRWSSGAAPCRDPEYEIAWTASPKHTDLYVTTRDLPLTVLEGYARNEQTG